MGSKPAHMHNIICVFVFEIEILWIWSLPISHWTRMAEAENVLQDEERCAELISSIHKAH